MATSNPLTDQHLSQIRNAMQTIEQAESQIMLAKQAGIDVTQAEANLAASKAKLLRIKNVYFPNS